MIDSVKDFWRVAIERHPEQVALLVGSLYLDAILVVWRS